MAVGLPLPSTVPCDRAPKGWMCIRGVHPDKTPCAAYELESRHAKKNGHKTVHYAVCGEPVGWGCKECPERGPKATMDVVHKKLKDWLPKKASRA